MTITERDESLIFEQQDRFGRKRRVMSAFSANLLRSNTAQNDKPKDTTPNVHTHGRRPRYI